MNRLSLVPLAAVAACSGAPVIQQSAPTAPESDPKTEAEVETALKTAKLIRDKCIGMLSDGGTSFRTEEDGKKVITTLGIIKGSQDGNTITEETCECVYKIDIPTFVHEKTSCEYFYRIRTIEDEKLRTEHVGRSKMSHREKSDGRSFTSSYAITYGSSSPLSLTSGLDTEIAADRSSCRTLNDQDINMPGDVALDQMLYTPEKLASCEYFADQVSIFVGEVRDAICGQLEKGGLGKNEIPPLCSKGKVYAPAPDK